MTWKKENGSRAAMLKAVHNGHETRKAIERETGYAYNTVKKRMEELVEEGHVEKDMEKLSDGNKRCVYGLTDSADVKLFNKSVLAGLVFVPASMGAGLVTSYMWGGWLVPSSVAGVFVVSLFFFAVELYRLVVERDVYEVRLHEVVEEEGEESITSSYDVPWS